ncbi:hypothetical protein LCGC14_1838700, partial [marine sediment metagenome]
IERRMASAGMDFVEPDQMVQFYRKRQRGVVKGTTEWLGLQDSIDQFRDTGATWDMFNTDTGFFPTRVGGKFTTKTTRKKIPGEEFAGKQFLETAEVRHRTGERFNINEYFKANRKKMLGRVTVESSMYDRTFVLKSDGRSIEQALTEAIADLPENIISEPLKSEAIQADKIVPPADHVKEGGLDIIDGALHRRVSDNMVPVDGPSVERVRGLLDLRNAVREVQRTQLTDAPEKDILSARKSLNKTYDKFLKKWGNTNDRSNASAMRGDPDYPLLKALERDTEAGGLEKADIFTKRVISPIKPVLSVETANDALLASLNERGTVDLAKMEQLSGIPQDELVEQLKGQIFQDPEDGWVQADTYLSGNVRKKLEAAQGAAEADPAFKDNVTALEKVQPVDLEAGDIEVRLGVPWVPKEDVQAFIAHLFDDVEVDVNYLDITSDWIVEVPAQASFALDEMVANTQKWGTNRYPGINIVRDTLNAKTPTIRDRVDSKTTVVNEKATQAARDKQNKIREEFKKWIFDDKDRRERLVRVYNDTYNNYRPQVFDGSHLKFEGKVPDKDFKLRPHQAGAVWRIVSSGRNTLLDHVVGSGKTATIITAAMELRRMGIRKKPMIAVPNHLLEQWGADFLALYPGANILVAGEKDFAPENRKLFASKVATGNWDAVIVAHSSFEFIPMSLEFTREMFESQVQALERAIADAVESGQQRRSPTVKQLEKSKLRLQARLKKVENKMKKDATVTFEELGVDHLFVDESQAFKNLFYFSKRTRVAGLGNPDGSFRAFDMFAKTRYMDKITGGTGVTFATGTPITNTIGEMFTIQRYLQTNVLEEAGIHNFDAWASLFGDDVTRIELAIAGGNKFTSKTR